MAKLLVTMLMVLVAIAATPCQREIAFTFKAFTGASSTEEWRGPGPRRGCRLSRATVVAAACAGLLRKALLRPLVLNHGEE